MLVQSARLAEFCGRGMSFNICRGTLGRLAIFTAIRNASSRVSKVMRRYKRRALTVGAVRVLFKGHAAPFLSAVRRDPFNSWLCRPGCSYWRPGW